MMKVFKSLSEVVINLIVHLMVLALCDLKATSTASWSCSLPPPGGNVFSRSLYAWPIQRVGLWPSPTQRQSRNSWQNKFDIWLNMLTTYSSCNLWCDWVKCFTKNILFIYLFFQKRNNKTAKPANKNIRSMHLTSYSSYIGTGSLKCGRMNACWCVLQCLTWSRVGLWQHHSSHQCMRLEGRSSWPQKWGTSSHPSEPPYTHPGAGSAD